MKFDYLEGDNEKRKGKIGSTMYLLFSCTYIFLYFYPRCPLRANLLLQALRNVLYVQFHWCLY